ncbi:MAG: hemerythrin family protein [Ignavibacteria bacterium]|nr:hemerythrin family protein [Ignavibacteria bacterium]
MDISWKESYSVGITKIDEQHKKLFELLNELKDAQENEKDYGFISKTISELFDYSVYHFKIEEDLLKEINYPHLNEHIEEHEYFRRQVSELQKMSNERKLILNVKLVIFLKEWIFTHILASDKDFGRFLKTIEK